MRKSGSDSFSLLIIAASPLPMLCVAAMVLAVVGCRRAGSSPVIATVDGRQIHRAEFERFLGLKMGEFTGVETPDALRSQMLDEYIERRIVLDEAAKAGLSVGDSEIDQAVQENPQIKSTAATAGAREELAADLLVRKFYQQVVLRDVRVSREEVQRYFDENQSRLAERPGFYVREIRVQSKEEAERLRRDVVEGNRDFAAAARLSSDAPNAERGGLTRYDEGQLPDVLGRAIRPLRPGDISPVVQSSFGYHIFKLERRIQPRPPEERRAQLDDRRGQLAEVLIARKNQEAVDQWLSQATSATTIKIDDSALGFTYVGRLRHN